MAERGAIRDGTTARNYAPAPLGFVSLVSAVLWTVTFSATAAAVLGISTLALTTATVVTWFAFEPRPTIATVGLVLAIFAFAPLVLLIVGLLVGRS